MPPLRLKYWRRRTARFACSHLFIIEFTLKAAPQKICSVPLHTSPSCPLSVVFAIVFDDPITTPHSQKVHRFTTKAVG